MPCRPNAQRLCITQVFPLMHAPECLRACFAQLHAWSGRRLPPGSGLSSFRWRRRNVSSGPEGEAGGAPQAAEAEGVLSRA